MTSHVHQTGGLTVGGWLPFAKHPQTLFPTVVARVLQYAGTDRGTGAAMSLYDGRDERFEGSIPEQIAKAADAIENWTPKVQALAPSGRFEPRTIIPRDVWLEGRIKRIFTGMRTRGLTDPIYCTGQQLGALGVVLCRRTR